MTHAMLALPNDPIGEPDESMAGRWDLYRRDQSFEEGLANATAAISTAIALLKARFGIRGRALPDLTSRKYAPAFDELRPLLFDTYAGYHAESTEVFMQAWEANKRDFGAFAGLAKLFATNFAGLDWGGTFEELKRGRIATGR